ncbi:J domain-containing protein 1 [Lithohypha guttulata]|uniref:J domain-containing protein 1 n=1 Tax=Lithohypha guttulata TaxID=1690604 RepID=UPI002DDEB371|nr:J domain-containing protein 1 [Lithohypha guttulata]
MSRREIYGKHTKLKYYELVKIYHPDRNGAGCETLSHIERLERYRLIILAHEIISDPNKRQAFDAYGAGWANKQTNPARHTRGYSTASGMQYGQAPGYDASPFGNATWEDWERWYRDHANQGQRQAYTGTYINPNAFAVFVITAAVLSGILQATSITQQAGTYADKSLAFTEETTRFMTARASQFDDNNLDKNDRVRHFLERRDPTRYGLKEEEESQYRKHFSKHEEVLPPIGRPGSVIGDIKRAEQDGQNTPVD